MDFTTPPPNMEPVAIYSDGGGLVDKYRMMAYQYRMEGRQVKILGPCRSACVLALSVPDVCIGPNAVVKAHHAYEEESGRLRPDMTKVIMDELPQHIRAEIEPHVRREYTEGATLTYEKMRSLGIPDCSQVKYKSKMVAAPVPRKVKAIRIVSKARSFAPGDSIFDLFTRRK